MGGAGDTITGTDYDGDINRKRILFSGSISAWAERKVRIFLKATLLKDSMPSGQGHGTTHGGSEEGATDGGSGGWGLLMVV